MNYLSTDEIIVAKATGDGKSTLDIIRLSGPSLIDTFKKNKNVRLANPGEFTRRSFENNKLDLIQVEAVGDLINAETENQRKEPYKQLEGGPSIKLKKIHNKIN